MNTAIYLLLAASLGADPVQITPWGEWTSPITSASLVAETVRLGEPRFDDNTLYWLETRPQEQGRTVLMAQNGGEAPREVLPAIYSVRSRVHEYGGGAYAVRNGIVAFVEFGGQQLHLLRPGKEVRKVTDAPDMRFADFQFIDDNTGIAVREDHADGREPVNTIVYIDLATGKQRVLVSGDDFYASPRVSPAADLLAWVSWNHPNMPWDGTDLHVADLARDSIRATRHIAGGPAESIVQPEWRNNDTLVYISDRSGWWNLEEWTDGERRALYPHNAEFAHPQWTFGQSTYGVVDSDTLVASYTENGHTHVGTLNVNNGDWTPLELPHTSIGSLQANAKDIVFLGGSPTRQSELLTANLATGDVNVIAQSSASEIDTAYVSVAEPLTFPTANGRTAHAFYYPPQNAGFKGPENTHPPLLVLSHGGPTSATGDTLDPRVLFWTSRGIAVVDVNYGGSTGYGRAYRERLRGNWGIVDVEDCIHAAQYLVEQGKADPERLAIRGGSAGGYTTLAALAFADTFKAGASYYGVADLEILARDTHKFESRYLDSLVGAYPAEKDKYIARSPIHHLDGLNCPVIFFQGLDDRVVPPNQSELMHEALKNNGVPTAYLPFEGEGHGFRRAENLIRSIEAELWFYGKVFGFTPADNIDPVEIANESAL